MESSYVALSSPPGSPELQAVLHGLDTSHTPERLLSQSKISGTMEDYRAHLRAIHDLPISIELIRGIVEKLHECKNAGAFKKGGHLTQAAEMLVVRPPDLRKGTITVGEYLYPSGAFTKDGVLKDKPYAAYIPSLISQCSENSEMTLIPCEWCASGRGAFASCRVDENHGGCCLNCWHSRSVWDCSLFDRRGEEKPKKKRIAVKTETQDPTIIPGTPAPMSAPVRKRKRSPAPEPAPKRVKTIKKPTKRAATIIAAPEPALTKEVHYDEPLDIRSDYAVSHNEAVGGVDIDSNLRPNTSIYSIRACDTITGPTENGKTLGETRLVGLELTEDALVHDWYEEMINDETHPPWLRGFSSPDLTNPILFGGTRRPKESFYAEMKCTSTPHTLRAPLIKNTCLSTRNTPLTRQTRPANLTSIIFMSSEPAPSRRVPPWQAQIESPADTQHATLFQGTRETSETFYIYFRRATSIQAKPASALLSVPALRTRKPPIPASTRALSSARLLVSKDKGRTVPGVATSALKTLARHAVSYVFD